MASGTERSRWSADVGRLGSLYIHAIAPMVGGDDMTFCMKLRRSYDPDHLWAAYDLLLHQNPALQVVFKPVGGSHSWVPINPVAVDRALDRQRERFAQQFSLEELLSSAQAMTPELPVRISQMRDGQVCFQMSHAFSNGRGALQWIGSWLAAADGESASVGQTAGRFDSNAPKIGMALLPVFLIGYLARTGLNHARETVDLTHGTAPPRINDYVSRTYSFPESNTDRILAKARAVHLSLTQYLCVAIAEAMLSAQPDKSRVCIGIPTDLTRYLPGLPRTVPGNYTGSLTVQLRRGAPLHSQVVRQFRWLRWGVDYSLIRLSSALSTNEQKVVDSIARTASLPFNQRGPFQNLSCTVSNLGAITLPAIESGTGTTKSQTILFTVFRFRGRLTTNVTFARDLYNSEEVFGVVDAALANLDR